MSEPDDDHRVVWVSLQSEVYHTREDCDWAGEKARRKSTRVHPIDDRRECTLCAEGPQGNHEAMGGGISKLERILRERGES